ncbi:MAG: LPS export ABC transporter periplasmic protein LptC [Flavobacteriales bacterium]|nr:LPS export ABC transporter periplasmic protein LptC [Flavobacteriales bacterium]|tara:strand:+ start:65 stop:589 length:525 start_codon:yes stop_codon:yes gene_type:complete
MKSIYLLVFTFILGPGCINKSENINLIYSDSLISDYGLGLEMNYYFDGDLEFKLIAQEIQELKYPVEKNVFPNGVKVLVFNKNFDTIAKINSDFAVQKKEEKLVELSNNVFLINEKNEQLSTEKLFWNSEEKKIYTDSFVTITTDNEIIMGYGFSANQSFSNYSLLNITGTIYL